MNENILVVEDDSSIREMLRFTLESDGYNCYEAEELTEAEAILSRENIHVLLIDWMLPGLSGIELAKRLRRNKKSSAIPIILVTAKAEETDKLKGFNAGIDDYVTKPFSPRELVLRVKNLLKRAEGNNKTEAERIIIGEITIKKDSHDVFVAGEKIDLTATEYKLLILLTERLGRVQSREVLLRDVWGYESDIDTRTVDTHVQRLRTKLLTSSEHIVSVRGFGYKFYVESQ